jgi:hypothetical protein
MKKENKGLLRKTLMVAVGLFLALPMMAFAQQRNSNWNTDQRRHNRDQRQDDGQDHRGRNWDKYGTYGGSFQLRQTALNAGYNEGIKEGRKDQHHNRRNYRNNSAYRNASKDYSSKLGDKSLYQRYYRDGYENGYEDGYRGY